MPTPIGISGSRAAAVLGQRICDICGKLFTPKTHNQKRCSNECKKIWLIGYNKKYHDEYYKNNSEYVKTKVREYRHNNKNKCAERAKRYYKNNSKKINKYVRNYKKERQSKDINFYLLRTFRRRLAVALKRQSSFKSIKTVELLGCSIEEFKTHIEKQFKPGMTFENHGDWHIDHIIPCASFDLSDPEQQKKCFHYTNLQPLWAKENILKGKKIS